MLLFIDCRLLESRAAWNGALPTYHDELAWLVSMPSNAFAHLFTTPNTIA